MRISRSSSRRAGRRGTQGSGAARRPRPDAGVTLLEILVVLALVGFAMITAVQTWSEWVPRARLRGAARELVQVVQRTRVTAVQRGVPGVVSADPASGEVLAFADVDGDPNPGDPEYAGYLRFAPDSAIPGRRTDFRIGSIDLLRVAFGGPVGGPHGADSLAGLTPVPSAAPGDPPVLAFGPDGSPLAGGGFRLLDAAAENVLEVAIEEVTGRVEIRKYLRGEDAPGGVAGFYPESQTAHGSTWVWY